MIKDGKEKICICRRFQILKTEKQLTSMDVFAALGLKDKDKC